MFMNKNTIEFKEFNLEIPKITEAQYTLLRHVLFAIEKNVNMGKRYYIRSDILEDLPFDKLVELLKTNLKISITDIKNNTWYGTNVINDIELKEDKIFFRPANILREIILNAKESPRHSYLKYILFNGIRYKQTLLFIDYMLKQKSMRFTIDVQDLKEVLELAPTQYRNFNAFKASVVDRIVEDINSKTTYRITCDTKKIKNGKRIISLTFEYYKQDIGN